MKVVKIWLVIRLKIISIIKWTSKKSNLQRITNKRLQKKKRKSIYQIIQTTGENKKNGTLSHTTTPK